MCVYMQIWACASAYGCFCAEVRLANKDVCRGSWCTRLSMILVVCYMASAMVKEACGSPPRMSNSMLTRYLFNDGGNISAALLIWSTFLA